MRVFVAVAVLLAVRVTVAVRVALGVRVVLGVRVTVGVCVMVGVRVEVEVWVGVSVTVPVEVTVDVCVGVSVTVSVGVNVAHVPVNSSGTHAAFENGPPVQPAAGGQGPDGTFTHPAGALHPLQQVCACAVSAATNAQDTTRRARNPHARATFHTATMQASGLPGPKTHRPPTQL